MKTNSRKRFWDRLLIKKFRFAEGQTYQGGYSGKNSMLRSNFRERHTLWYDRDWLGSLLSLDIVTWIQHLCVRRIIFVKLLSEDISSLL